MAKLTTETRLYQDIKTLIEQSRQRSASAINAEISLLYWHVGKRIKVDILKDERAEYGKGILDGLSAKLTQEYGKGWSIKQLWHCLKFVEIFPDSRIVSALRRQLSWTSIKTIIYIGQKRIAVDNEDYYIDLLFYHRRLKCLVAIDLKLGKFKAAYKGQMENAILLELEKFIIEFGNGFAFMERQKRIIIGSIQ